MMLRISISRAIVIASILILGVGLCAGPAMAFTGANHCEIDNKALGGLLSKDAIDDINAGNVAVDDGKRAFKPEEHCLRDPKTGATDAEAFLNAGRHVQDLKKKILAAIRACHTDEAHKLLEEAMHTIQDMYAHTNFVFLSDEDRRKAKDAFDDPDNPAETVPAGLEVAAYSGTLNNDGLTKLFGQFYPTDNNGVPDPCPHGLLPGDCNLDVEPWPWPITGYTPGSGAQQVTINGVTKSAWEWAMEFAAQHCREFVESIINALAASHEIDKWNTKFRDWKRPPPPPPPPPPTPPKVRPPSLSPTQGGSIYPGLSLRRRLPAGSLLLVTSEGGILDDGNGTAVFIPDGALVQRADPAAVGCHGARCAYSRDRERPNRAL